MRSEPATTTDAVAWQEDLQARARLAALQAKLGDLHGWLPNGSLGAQSPLQPTGLRIYVQKGAPNGDPKLEQAPLDWPLDARPLASFGEPVQNLDGFTAERRSETISRR